jgi:probable phosphoglycerate mutase
VSGASLWIVRHGETTWSRDGLHTSVTDLELTPNGVEAARSIGERLAGLEFAMVLTSPRRRARQTAELVGYPDAVVEEDLAEWAYGEYEGVSTAEIRKTVPGWTIWTHGAPGGETARDVAERLDRVIARVRTTDGDVLVFGHSHALRALTARWLGLDVTDGRLFRLDTATVSVLGYERETPVILRWNAE